MGDENLASKEKDHERTGPGSPVVRDQEKDRRFALFLRYQTTNDRAFTRALYDLLKLEAEKRKARLDEAALLQRAEDVKIGFESQKQKQAAETRREAAETRKEEEAARRARTEERKQGLHQHAVSLAEMKVSTRRLSPSRRNRQSHCPIAPPAGNGIRKDRVIGILC